jgi:hypothetical protein
MVIFQLLRYLTSMALLYGLSKEMTVSKLILTYQLLSINVLAINIYMYTFMMKWKLHICWKILCP